ncbi:pentapeptide repeat-containing protein [Clostridium bornimense]|uniref:pentapeptide repeat-containing protein n=1 Tax=Clostridium bornimense TaxID=1216932 RepID=UPI001C115A83|nr:pentapeptide repeat-containing protein [Clostridium bornimense]MBU5316229.1 pentapeptide repeat-containing protein [Clostridium bornimense]
MINKFNLDEILSINCDECFGLCCVALYFSKSEGFPTDKEADKPCVHLNDDFRCKVHEDLKSKGLKGCIAYDCFGAGQKVAESTYKRESWRDNPNKRKEIFDVFVVMRQLYEMLWYLKEAYRINKDEAMRNNIETEILEIIALTDMDGKSLLDIDIKEYRKKVNPLLLTTSESLRKRNYKSSNSKVKRSRMIAGRLDLMGANLRNRNLVGEDFSGALLIEADLRKSDLSYVDVLGADFRDADLSGANLEKAIYLTQGQVNSAKGDSNTKLPKSLKRPRHW